MLNENVSCYYYYYYYILFVLRVYKAILVMYDPANSNIHRKISKFTVTSVVPTYKNKMNLGY